MFAERVIAKRRNELLNEERPDTTILFIDHHHHHRPGARRSISMAKRRRLRQFSCSSQLDNLRQETVLGDSTSSAIRRQIAAVATSPSEASTNLINSSDGRQNWRQPKTTILFFLAAVAILASQYCFVAAAASGEQQDAKLPTVIVRGFLVSSSL